jgi:hypothetical protein
MTKNPKKPTSILIAVGLLVLEAVSILSVLAGLVLELASGRYQNLVSSIFLVALGAGAIAWVLLFTRELFRGRRWARSAAVFWQLLLAAVGAGATAESGSNQLIGFGLILLAGITMVLLFMPSVVEATRDQNED